MNAYGRENLDTLLKAYRNGLALSRGQKQALSIDLAESDPELSALLRFEYEESAPAAVLAPIAPTKLELQYAAERGLIALEPVLASQMATPRQSARAPRSRRRGTRARSPGRSTGDDDPPLAPLRRLLRALRRRP